MKKKNVKKVSNIPYSNKYLADELKSCLTPLLKKKEIVEKWSPEIPSWVEIAMQDLFYDSEYVLEDCLLMKIDKNTYANSFKEINYETMLLIGKMILKGPLGYTEVAELIFSIKKELYFMENIGWFIESWLCDDVDLYESEDYAILYDDVKNANKKFINIFNNYAKMKIKNLNLKNKPIHIQKDIERLKLIYSKLLEFGFKIFELDINDTLYIYKDKLKNFVRNLANELMYVAGELYVGAENKTNIKSSARKTICNYITELETQPLKNDERLCYMFDRLKEKQNYASNFDKEVFNAYTELRNSIVKIILSNRR